MKNDLLKKIKEAQSNLEEGLEALNSLISSWNETLSATSASFMIEKFSSKKDSLEAKFSLGLRLLNAISSKMSISSDIQSDEVFQCCVKKTLQTCHYLMNEFVIFAKEIAKEKLDCINLAPTKYSFIGPPDMGQSNDKAVYKISYDNLMKEQDVIDAISEVESGTGAAVLPGKIGIRSIDGGTWNSWKAIPKENGIVYYVSEPKYVGKFPEQKFTNYSDLIFSEKNKKEAKEIQKLIEQEKIIKEEWIFNWFSTFKLELGLV